MTRVYTIFLLALPLLAPSPCPSISGSGDATSFTASSVYDRVEDIYDFHDHADGTVTATTATEGDGDTYHNQDDGHSDEVLTLHGGAGTLGADYSDDGHNDFGDSDRDQEQWNDPAAHDSGHNTGHDSDGGTEQFHLESHGTLSDWQGSGGGWQIGSVQADVTGSANVDAGDDGSDGVAVGPDSDTDTFNDHSQGDETFGYHLHGDGTSATLQQGETVHLTTHTEDHEVDNWADPAGVAGLPATDIGSETIGNTEDDGSTVIVQANGAIGADGSYTPTSNSVDVTGTGSFGLTDGGSDGEAAGAASDQAGGNDTLHMGQGFHVHTDSASGSTSVTFDRNLGGSVGLTGWDDNTDGTNPGDVEGDVASGGASGSVSGDVHQTGSVVGDQLQGGAPSGHLGLNLTGSNSDTATQVIDTSAGGAPSDIPVPFLLDVTAFPGSGSYPGFILWWPVPGTRITVTESDAVPSSHITDSETLSGGAWSLGSLDYGSRQIHTVSFGGTYSDGLLDEGGYGTASYSDTHEVSTTDSGSGAGLHGTRTDRETTRVELDVTNDADVTVTQTGHSEGTLTTTVVDTGDRGPDGADAGATEERTVSGTSSGSTHLANKDGNGNYTGGYTDITETASQDYHQHEVDTGDGEVFLTEAEGTDQYSARVDRFGPSGIQGGVSHYAVTRQLDRTLGNDNNVATDYTEDQHYWGVTVDAAGNPTPYDYDYPPTPTWGNRGFLDGVSDFSAGMADTITGGLTQKIRAGLGYDDVVDHNSGAYRGGEIAGEVVNVGLSMASPCGQARAIGYAMRGLSAAQGVSSTLDAAEAVKQGDPLGAAGSLLSAGLSFGAASRACFAAGTPMALEHGCVAVERVREGDCVASRDEHDPDGPVVLRRVLHTFQGTAPIWHLYAGGRLIRTTGPHPFWARGKGWTAASALQPGDELRTETGWVRCDEVVDSGRTETVYNIEVEGGHTYFAGDPVAWGFALWAHNAGCMGSYASLRGKLAGSGKQAHHLIEKRFAGLFGQRAQDMLSIGVSPAKHQAFTNAWRRAIGYGNGTADAVIRGRAFVEDKAREVYKNYPGILKALGL